jgi:hypothetical protein
MNPLLITLLLVLCSKFYCSESDIFPRGDVFSLEDYVRIQTSNDPPTRADNINERGLELEIPRGTDHSSLHVLPSNLAGNRDSCMSYHPILLIMMS